jgi:hypothetical protein
MILGDLRRRVTGAWAAARRKVGALATEVVRADLDDALDRLVDRIDEIGRWRAATGCETPEFAQPMIHSLQRNARLQRDEIRLWIELTGYDEPGLAAARINDLEKEVEGWRAATGCQTPEMTRQMLQSATQRDTGLINDLEKEVEKWRDVTGCQTPGALEDAIRAQPAPDAAAAPTVAANFMNEIRPVVDLIQLLNKLDASDAQAARLKLQETAHRG